jgi:hypothetical protein
VRIDDWFLTAAERSIARGYLKALPRARSLIYLEDQYLWSTAVVAALARSLRGVPPGRRQPGRLAPGRAARAPAAGRLRGYRKPALSPWTRTWARVPYRLVYDRTGARRRCGGRGGSERQSPASPAQVFRPADEWSAAGRAAGITWEAAQLKRARTAGLADAETVS